MLLPLLIWNSIISSMLDTSQKAYMKRRFSALGITIIDSPKTRYTIFFFKIWIKSNSSNFYILLFFFSHPADIPASGLYFLTYECVKEVAAKELGTEGSRALIGTILAGGSAGVANWLVGMPADVLKSRLQTGNYTPPTLVQVPLPIHHWPHHFTIFDSSCWHLRWHSWCLRRTDAQRGSIGIVQRRDARHVACVPS